MSGRAFERPAGVRWNSAWPYTKRPAMAHSEGPWELAISIHPDMNGLVVYYPTPEGAPEVWGSSNQPIAFKSFYRVETKEDAEKFCVMFCSRGYGRHWMLEQHQEGTLWGFNWTSLTMSTPHLASQVADHYFHGRVDEAWNLGREFEELLRAAERAAYEEKEKSA